MHLFFEQINTFHLLHFRASEVKEQISNGTIAKRLHDILADLVNSMTGFLQITPTNINEKMPTSIYFSTKREVFFKYIPPEGTTKLLPAI